ncbi:MAG: DUF86 domain-containing protein [Nitrospirae bacterium]|nr:DUF86 domain-containing protein [Nitrospirota bacterium]
MAPGVVDRLLVFREALAALGRYQSTPPSSWESDLVQRSALERLLQKGTKALIDLGTHLVAEKLLPKPRRAAEVFEVLREAEILEPALADKMKKRVQFRNIIIHEYATVTAAQLREALTDLTDLAQVATILAGRLDLSTEI